MSACVFHTDTAPAIARRWQLVAFCCSLQHEGRIGFGVLMLRVADRRKPPKLEGGRPSRSGPLPVLGVPTCRFLLTK